MPNTIINEQCPDCGRTDIKHLDGGLCCLDCGLLFKKFIEEVVYSKSDLLALKEKLDKEIEFNLSCECDQEDGNRNYNVPCGICKFKRELDAVFDSVINGAVTQSGRVLDAGISKVEGSNPSSPSYCHHIWNTSGYCVLCGKKQAVEYK